MGEQQYHPNNWPVGLKAMIEPKVAARARHMNPAPIAGIDDEHTGYNWALPKQAALQASANVDPAGYYPVGVRGKDHAPVGIFSAPFFHSGITHFGEQQMAKKKQEVLLQSEQLTNRIRRAEVAKAFGLSELLRAQGDFATADEMEKSVTNQMKALQEIQGQMVTTSNELIDMDLQRAQLDDAIDMRQAYLSVLGQLRPGDTMGKHNERIAEFAGLDMPSNVQNAVRGIERHKAGKYNDGHNPFGTL